MLYFPQLPSGATGQYPIKKTGNQRTIISSAPDGHAFKLADSGAVLVEWQLQYQNLTDAEINVLEQFFLACDGQLIAFAFADPVGNLLAWSEALDQPVWEASTLLQVTGGISRSKRRHSCEPPYKSCRNRPDYRTDDQRAGMVFLLLQCVCEKFNWNTHFSCSHCRCGS